MRPRWNCPKPKKKPAFNSIKDIIQAKPNLNPHSNRIIPDPLNPFKCRLEQPLPQGSFAAASAMEGLGKHFRNLTKQNIIISFEYIEEGEIKSDKITVYKDYAVFESLRKMKNDH